jgi:hypothetical protein
MIVLSELSLIVGATPSISWRMTAWTPKSPAMLRAKESLVRREEKTH